MEQIDHILIRVENLKEAIIDFEKMGFNIVYGTIPQKTYNAMIYFEDESFIELVDVSKFPKIVKGLGKLGIQKWMSSFYKRIFKYATSEEIILDFAIYRSNFSLLENKRTKKAISSVFKMKRKNHLGDLLRWELASPNNLDLPFIMSDYTPYKYPNNECLKHPNGVVGISRLTLPCKGPLNNLYIDLKNIFDVPSERMVITNASLKVNFKSVLVEYVSYENAKSLVVLKTNLPSFEKMAAKYSVLIQSVR